jgi:transposase
VSLPRITSAGRIAHDVVAFDPRRGQDEQEFRDRAVRMYRDRLAEPGGSKLRARWHVGSLLDRDQATLRNWVEDAERAGGQRGPAASRTGDSEEVRALKKRVAELERANEILKTSAAFFAQVELDRRLK